VCPVTCHGHPSNFFRFNSSSMSCFMTNAVDSSSSVRRRVIVVLELAKACSRVNYFQVVRVSLIFNWWADSEAALGQRGVVHNCTLLGGHRHLW